MNPYLWNNSYMANSYSSNRRIDAFFNRLENLLNNAEVKVETVKTVTFTVTEGDDEAINRAMKILESLRSKSSENSKDTIDKATKENDEKFSEEFKGDNA